MSTDFVLHTEHLKKYYKSVHAVEDISLNVQQGEIFGFLGPNGSGKTTTIGMILGLIYPTSGSVEIFGQPVTPLHNTVLRRVGALMGAPMLMQGFSARQNLQMMAHLFPEVTPQRINEVLTLVGLQGAANRAVKQFSTGMKQRMGLALALLNRPDILILDEPTNGMDPAGMHEIRELLRKLASEGTTIFLSSHLLHEMEMVCDRVVIVGKGRVLTEGTVADLLKGREATRIKTPDAQAAATLLQAAENPDVHVTIYGPYIDVQGLPVEQAVEQLVYNKLTPSEVFHVRRNLESVFLELTQEPTQPQALPLTVAARR